MLILSVIAIWFIASGVWFYQNRGNNSRKDKKTDWIFIPPILLVAFVISLFKFPQ
jgi:hypothetical protein